MLHYLNMAARAAAPTRRGFLKMSAGAAGGVVIGGMIARPVTAQQDDAPPMEAAPYVRLSSDGMVTVIVKHLDKGQGIATGLATLVAEELDANPDTVRTEFAPSNPQLYKNFLFGVQGTGGSTGMANSFDQYRQAGAILRHMLVAAAAEAWGVDPSEVTAKDGVLTAGDRSAPYGDMAEAAAVQPLPEDVPLKSPEQWALIGKDFPRMDLPEKVQGSVGLFGMDLQMEGMLVAVTARPPRFGGTVKSVDDTEARAVRGVVDILTVPQGVVVLAEATWPAIKARDLLSIEWDFSNAENRGTDDLVSEYKALMDTPGTPAQGRGDAVAALENAAQVVESTYVFPYLAHAPMEPLDITVLYDGETAEFWTGSQIQTLDHGTAAAVLDLQFPQIRIHTMWAGGSFGRRAIFDSHYTAEAATIARTWLEAGNAARPIKLVYTREDDIKGGYYRPMHMHRVRAGVDADGNVSGWDHRIVGQSIFTGTPMEQMVVHDGVDHSSVEGVVDTPYGLTDMAVDVHHPKVGVPVLWWRSVGHTHTAFVMETMMDRLAEAAGADPVAFRLNLLKDQPRMAGVLELAAEKAGWDSAPAEGRHRGIAVHKSFNSYVAEVAEVSMRDDGTVKVEKVVCAIDCGVAVHPDSVRAQVQGGVGYGLSAILREEVTMTGGEVDQSNFYDYMPLRIPDMPEVEVHIVPSAEAPTGVGEPGVPPIGPAVANAIAKATGQVVTELPLTKAGLSV